MRRPNRRPNYSRLEDITNYQAADDYIIYKNGATTICIDGNTGQEVSRNTDSQTVIQYALDIVEPGRVYLKPDLYTLTDTLTIANEGTEFCSNMWRGDSGDLRGLWLDDSVNKDVINVTGAKCHLHNLFVDGNGANNTAGSCIITANDAGLDLHLGHCYLFHAKERGLELHGGAGFFDGVYCEYSLGQGIKITSNGTRNSFVNCGAYANTSFGIEIQTDDNRFTNCITADGASHGFLVEGKENTIINACTSMRDGLHGIWIYGGVNSIITNNVIRDASNDGNNTSDGIYISSLGGVHSTRNVIMGNRISSSSANDPRYCINEADANQNSNIVVGNICTNGVTDQIRTQGAQTVEANNIEA